MLSAGATVGVENARGRTAADLAKKGKHKAVLELLRSAAAGVEVATTRQLPQASDGGSENDSVLVELEKLEAEISVTSGGTAVAHEATATGISDSESDDEKI